MKAFITGGTGLMGIALVAALRMAGDEVVALGSRDVDLRDPAAAEAVLARHHGQCR